MIEKLSLQAVSHKAIKLPGHVSLKKEMSIAITKDNVGLAEFLCNQFNKNGYRAQVVTWLPTQCDCAIVLEGVNAFNDVESALEINHKAFSQARIIASHFTSHPGIFVAVQNTGGDFGLSKLNERQAYSAGMTGLIKTAAQEWPAVRCQVIDVDLQNYSKENLAERIYSEIIANSGDVECGLLASGERITLEMVSYTSNSTALSQTHNKNLFVVSGGARGITAACLMELAQTQKASFALLGRTSLFEDPPEFQSYRTEAELRKGLIDWENQQGRNVVPKDIQKKLTPILANREALKTIETLKHYGSEVSYFSVDIQKFEQLQKILDQIRSQFGPITGIIHGAGVLADKLIAQKTDEQFHKVFNTKVIGLKNLLRATKNDPLNTILLFSSVAGRFGNMGQCDYAMANEVLNKVAQYERQTRGAQCCVKSINWGPWESGMVTEELKKLFADRGISILSKKQGTQIFIEELNSRDSNVEVIVGGSLQKNKPLPEIHSDLTSLFSISISAESHAFLTSHIVKDVPVLPACLVLEWFAKAARQLIPQANKYCFRNFKVLRGIRLEQFYKNHEPFTVCYEQNQEGYQLKLYRVDSSLPNYSVQIVKNPESIFHPKIEISVSDKNGWYCDIDELYFDKTITHNGIRLFHGTDFQSIHSLEYVTDEGGCGYLKGVVAKKWPGEWHIDALAIDGLLQLGWLWTVRMINRPTLPTEIKEIFVYDANPYSGLLKCIFKCWTVGHYSARGDFFLLKENGEPYLSAKSAEICTVSIESKEISYAASI